MSDAASALSLLGLAAVALAIASLAALRGWRGWLELRRIQLASPPSPLRRRSELSDLRARIRRLEAIAEGRG